MRKTTIALATTLSWATGTAALAGVLVEDDFASGTITDNARFRAG